MSPKKKSDPFWWFGPEQTAEIRDNLNAAGEGARLEVHHDDNEDDITVFVIPAGEVVLEGGGGTNESHICPPVCP